MRILNLEKFKEECAKFDKSEIKALLFDFAFERILRELVLVDVIRSCRKNGEAIPKSEVLSDYAVNLEGERFLITLLGRRESARIYGRMEEITSDVKTVDYILSNDSVEYYKKMIGIVKNPKGLMGNGSFLRRWMLNVLEWKLRLWCWMSLRG